MNQPSLWSTAWPSLQPQPLVAATTAYQKAMLTVPPPAPGAITPAPFITPALPTYQTAAALLEGKWGAGWRLGLFTLLRAAFIAVPFLLIRVRPKQAIAGSLLASGLISLFTLIRIENAHRTFQPRR